MKSLLDLRPRILVFALSAFLFFAQPLLAQSLEVTGMSPQPTPPPPYVPTLVGVSCLDFLYSLNPYIQEVNLSVGTFPITQCTIAGRTYYSTNCNVSPDQLTQYLGTAEFSILVSFEESSIGETVKLNYFSVYRSQTINGNSELLQMHGKTTTGGSLIERGGQIALDTYESVFFVDNLFWMGAVPQSYCYLFIQ